MTRTRRAPSSQACRSACREAARATARHQAGRARTTARHQAGRARTTAAAASDEEDEAVVDQAKLIAKLGAAITRVLLGGDRDGGL